MSINQTNVELLKKLGLPRLVQPYIQTCCNIDAKSESFETGMEQLLEFYFEDKQVGIVEKNRINADLVYPAATLSEIDLRYYPSIKIPKLERIMEGDWVGSNDSTIVYGDNNDEQVRLCCVIANSLLDKGHSLTCISLIELLYSLLLSQTHNTLKKDISKLSEVDVLFIYDWYLDGLTYQQSYLLSSLIEARENKGGLFISASSHIKSWPKETDDIGLVNRIEQYIAPKEYSLKFERVIDKESNYVH
jgi:DNA replication protein DnaC